MPHKRADYSQGSDYVGALPGYEATYTNAPVPAWAPAAGLAAGGLAAAGAFVGGRRMLRKFMAGKPAQAAVHNPAAAWEAELAARTHVPIRPQAKVGSHELRRHVLRGLGHIARGE